MSFNIFSCSLTWQTLIGNVDRQVTGPGGSRRPEGNSHAASGGMFIGLAQTPQREKLLMMDGLLVFSGTKPGTLGLLRLGLAEIPHLKIKLLFSQSKYQMIKRNDSLLISCWKHSETCFVYCYSANQWSTAGRESNYKCKFPISAWKVCWKDIITAQLDYI